mgnify:CR=1 FL=1
MQAALKGPPSPQLGFHPEQGTEARQHADLGAVQKDRIKGHVDQAEFVHGGEFMLVSLMQDKTVAGRHRVGDLVHQMDGGTGGHKEQFVEFMGMPVEGRLGLAAQDRQRQGLVGQEIGPGQQQGFHGVKMLETGANFKASRQITGKMGTINKEHPCAEQLSP